MNEDQFHDEELLSAYLDGELTTDELDRVAQRLQVDPEYQQLLDELKSLRGYLRAVGDCSLPDNFAERVIRSAERRILTGKSDATPDTADSSIAPASARTAWLFRHAGWWTAALAAGLMFLMMLPEWRATKVAPVALQADKVTKRELDEHPADDTAENLESNANKEAVSGSGGFAAAEEAPAALGRLAKPAAPRSKVSSVPSPAASASSIVPSPPPAEAESFRRAVQPMDSPSPTKRRETMNESLLADAVVNVQLPATDHDNAAAPLMRLLQRPAVSGVADEIGSSWRGMTAKSRSDEVDGQEGQRSSGRRSGSRYMLVEGSRMQVVELVQELAQENVKVGNVQWPSQGPLIAGGSLTNPGPNEFFEAKQLDLMFPPEGGKKSDQEKAEDRVQIPPTVMEVETTEAEAFLRQQQGITSEQRQQLGFPSRSENPDQSMRVLFILQE